MRCKAYKSVIWCWRTIDVCKMENCGSVSEQEEKLLKIGKHSFLAEV
ncbi:hypothetical protein [Methanobrevibacter cuticularis]|nr:hypothetical protein [Methanobrevibacter cuticularis]